MITIIIIIIIITIIIIIIIDVAIPDDGRVGETEDEKVEKYQDLARTFRKMWDVRKKVNSVLIWGIRNSANNEFEKQAGPGCSKHG